MLILISKLSCSDGRDSIDYVSFSRFTDPKDFSFMLNKLPDDIIEICKVAEQQMVHQNLMIYHNVPYKRNEGIPPRMPKLLKMLRDKKPYNLYEEREIKHRIVSSCIVESHFLAGLLRYKDIPARTRAGNFKNVLTNPKHYTSFWEKTFRGRGVMRDLLTNDPDGWQEWVNSFISKQIQDNHYIEHWICEYWDEEMNKWRILDANTTFLRASCGIDVDYLLSQEYFEYSFEAWKKMRSDKNFNPDQYREDEQDGPFHIRKSLLWDFFSLLNHDIAGMDSPSSNSRELIYKPFGELSRKELKELDLLANLLSKNPSRDELVEFYQNNTTFKLEDVEKDPYSFVFTNK